MGAGPFGPALLFGDAPWANAGYSGTPLAKKLGLKGGAGGAPRRRAEKRARGRRLQGFCAHGTPRQARRQAAERPVRLHHAFETDETRLAKSIAALQKALAPAGMIWISCPKKAAKVEDDPRREQGPRPRAREQACGREVCAGRRGVVGPQARHSRSRCAEGLSARRQRSNPRRARCDRVPRPCAGRACAAAHSASGSRT